MKNLRRVAKAILPLGMVAISCMCDAAPAAPKSSEWKTVDKLVADQKLEAASQAVAKIRERARAAGNEPEWAEALVKEVQLRMALSGYETAVRFLREQPWPKGALERTALDLYYARALTNYLSGYSWEIGQREKVDSKGPLDLKKWTQDQIVTEALKAYDEAWARRAELGDKPVDALAAYLTPNNYPKQIRGTLRDALSYLAVELLADSSRWRPEQSNDLFRLDFGALLAGGDAKRARAVKLADEALHPLEKISAVLDDLEAWHASRGQKEAVLETRLERVRRLHASFSDEKHGALLRKDLTDRLPAFRQLEWWAMGQAELAELVRSTGDLVQVRALALEGVAAFPTSIGGGRCNSIVKAIEAPDFQVSSMQSDGLGKRSIEVTHRNLEKLYFRAYAVDLFDRVAKARDYNLLPGYQEYRGLLGGKPASEWTVALPATPDYQPHRTFVTTPMQTPGLYVVYASVSPGWKEAQNRVLALNLIAGDLVIVSHSDPPSGNLEVNVVSGSTGKPVAGAEVSLWRYDWQRKHTRVETRKSDGKGETTFAGGGARASQGGSYFVLARHGKDVALDGNYIGFYAGGLPGETWGSLVYTDRSIYRPLQKLYWKVVAYHGRADQGKLSAWAGQALTVSLVDANGQEVDKREVKSNEFGSAAGEFVLPAGRLLGEWTVRSSLNGSQSVHVEEYKRPTFEVALKDPESALRLNKPAKLTGEAKYYFGLPVSNGNIKWRVTREPVYPWWWGWYGHGGGSGTQTIATGTAPLEPDGKFHLVFTPEADEPRDAAARAVTYRYSVSADLTDEGGETRSAERAFRLGFVTVESSLSTETAFVVAGERAEVALTRTDLDGIARPGKGSWRLVALTQPASTVVPSEMPIAFTDGKLHTPGDRLRARSANDYSPQQTMAQWADGKESARGQVTHDGKGIARVTLPALAAGAYRLRYETVDDFGARYENWRDLVVAPPAGQPSALRLPGMLEVERPSLSVGKRARVLAFTGLDDQPYYLDKYRDGHLVERRRLQAGSAALVELPIGEQDRGGFGLSLWLVRDHQRIALAQTVFVPWEEKQLAVELSTFRDKIRPGQKETWRVTVKGANATEGAAELLAYMYDRSLDVFATHSPPSALSLYPSHASTTWPTFSLGAAGSQWVYSSDIAHVPGWSMPHGDYLHFYDDWGIGGPGGRFRASHAVAFGGELRRDEEAPPSAQAAPAPKPTSPATGTSAKDKTAEFKDGDNDHDGIPDKQDRAATGAKSGEQPAQVRSNFAETAFWQPRLYTDGKGEATIEFQVPDSVTGWNVWVHAITRDLRSGSTVKQTRSVKDLLVRPYLPRFFREGDKADLKVVVNNASEGPLSGTLDFDIVDPDTQKSVRDLFGFSTSSQPFTVKAGGGTNLTFPVVAPKKVGTFAFRVSARAGNVSDGELRPLPVLPGRMHLVQSRFVTLRDKDKRVMKFDDLAKSSSDPTLIQEQMVVTVEAQLFYTVLKALPYLIHYPYECTEQTVNRFVSTGIVSSLFKQYPAVAKMAEGFSKRQTQLEPFDAADPNRKMTLEESPWLQESRGSDTGGVSVDLIDVLDPRVARANRDSALLKLRKMQTGNGAFPWFPGGPPSPYMTLYLMHSFAKAAEFGVDVPKDVVQRGWSYLALHFREHYIDLMRKNKADWEFLTFLNYAASSYPDASYTGNALTEAERKEILDYSYKHWKQHSPYLKGMLALTLKRMGRKADGVKVFESVMDSAKTAPDQGTFWAQEDRSWLWYNDTIESHAFALRVLMELQPENPKKDGLVLWLLINKKLNQWKSTRATAEVIYSLAHYLKKEGALGIREDATVSVGPVQKTYAFEPDQYAGKQQLVLRGNEIDPQTSSTITVEKQSKGVVFASATWHFSTEKLPDEGRGDFFQVHRAYFKRVEGPKGAHLTPLAEGATIVVGDEIEVQLSLRSKHQAEYVHLRDPRAAGLEPEAAVSQYKWDLGIGFYEETRDSGANFFFESLPVGEYTFKYRLRANLAGTFRVGPATVQSMYAPEFNAYSAGHVLSVK